MKKLHLFLLLIHLLACHSPNPPSVSFLENSPSLLQKLPSKAPSTIVRNIIKGSQGNLWMATGEGILYYDGTAFKNLTQELTSSRFFGILEDSQGKLWMGSLGSGLYAYDGQQWEHWTTKEGLVDDHVLYIYEDSKGLVWIGTQGGLSCYNGVNFKNFTTAQGLPHLEVNALIETKEGQLWIGTKGAACYYDGQQLQPFYKKNEGQLLPLGQEVSFENVRYFLKDNKARIWLAGQDGLWLWNGKTFQVLSEHFATYLYQDATETIWVTAKNPATNEWELSYYQTTTLNPVAPTAVLVKSTATMLFGMAKDKTGNLWVGHLNGVLQCDATTFHCYEK